MAKRKKKDGIPWLLVAGIGAGLWWAFSSPASAAQAPASVGPAAQAYMNQLTASQAAYLAGNQSLAQYQAAATGIVAGAQVDPAVSSADFNTLKGVAGALS